MKSVNFDLDTSSKIKLYFQLYTKLSEQILSGEIPAGTKLPSVRTLSTQLNISRNTVTKALEDLQNDGFIVSKNKSGFYAIVPEKKSIPTNAFSSVPIDSQMDADNSSARTQKPKSSILTVDDILAKAASSLNQNAVEIQDEMESDTFFPESEPQNDDSSVFTVESVTTTDEPDENLTPEVSPKTDTVEQEQIAIVQNPVLRAYLEAYQSEEFQQMDAVSIELNFELSLKSSYLYKNLSVDDINLVAETNSAHLFNNIAKMPALRTIVSSNGEYQQQKQGGLLKIATQAQLNSKIQPVMFTCGLNGEYQEDRLIVSIFKKNNFYVEEVSVSSLNPEYLSMQNVTLLLVTDEELISEEILGWCRENPHRHIICITDSTIMNPQPQCIYVSSMTKLTDSKVNVSWALMETQLYSDYTSAYPQNQNGISLMDKCFCAKFIANISNQNQ